MWHLSIGSLWPLALGINVKEIISFFSNSCFSVPMVKLHFNSCSWNFRNKIDNFFLMFITLYTFGTWLSFKSLIKIFIEEIKTQSWGIGRFNSQYVLSCEVSRFNCSKKIIKKNCSYHLSVLFLEFSHKTRDHLYS